MVVSPTNAVNPTIKLTKPSVGVVNWRSTGSGGGFHHEPADKLKHLLGHLPRHSHLGELGHQPPGVADQPSPDLDEPDLHTAQRSVFAE